MKPSNSEIQRYELYKYTQRTIISAAINKRFLPVQSIIIWTMNWNIHMKLSRCSGFVNENLQFLEWVRRNVCVKERRDERKNQQPCWLLKAYWNPFSGKWTKTGQSVGVGWEKGCVNYKLSVTGRCLEERGSYSCNKTPAVVSVHKWCG